ncbi:1,4-dihydroxy-6-naphtoate synthase [compost metagenome]
MSHAQEMSPDVTQAHINLYVNKYTEDLGADGYGAISVLLNRAAEEGLVPHIDPALLR